MTHPWIGQTVYDIASGQTGTLAAVVEEPTGFASGAPRVARLAYVRSAKQVEWSTALGNLSLASAAP
ncbi:hypothetical protein ACIBEA_29640 [Streptomyces sp. NPDC051555]|uniref:hypothetical protein n=1 Tax=Streptomyces sp. NPDC051555 TaxID=3365657 RepID=UPI0037979604